MSGGNIYRVFGRVQVRETSRAVAGLVVAVFDRDPSQRPPIEQLPPSELFSGTNVGNRIGSTITDADGSFELTYDVEDFRTATERRPDLVVVVLAPEDQLTVDRAFPTRSRTKSCTYRPHGRALAEPRGT